MENNNEFYLQITKENLKNISTGLKCKCSSSGDCVWEGVFNENDCKLKSITEKCNVKNKIYTIFDLANDISILISNNKISDKNKLKSVKMFIELVFKMYDKNGKMI